MTQGNKELQSEDQRENKEKKSFILNWGLVCPITLRI